MEYKFIEIENKNGLVLRGVLNYNKNLDNKKTVIILHGFTGNKLGNSFFYVRISKEFVKRGFKVFRFDFTGSGESDGNFEDMTLTSELDDLDSIWEYVKNHDMVMGNKIYMIGHSMGGLITTLTASTYNPDKVVLLAPANDMNSLIENMLLEMEKKENRRLESVKHQGFILKRKFLEDLKRYNPYVKAKKYSNPVLIFLGDKDPIITLESCQKTKEAFGKNADLKIVEGGDHSFVDYDIRTDMIEEIIKFFE